MKISVETVAEMINDDCIPGRYFWACGLVRETAKLWAVMIDEWQTPTPHNGYTDYGLKFRTRSAARRWAQALVISVTSAGSNWEYWD